MRKNSRSRLIVGVVIFISGAIVWSVYGSSISHVVKDVRKKTHNIAQNITDKLK